MGFRLTDRDIEIIRQVERFRLLRSRDHIVPLFGGSKHILRRLQKLTENKYLYRLPERENNEQAIYAVGNAGANLLSERFDLPRPKVDYTQKSKDLGGWFIDHTLLVADIMVAIMQSARARDDICYISREEILMKWASEERRKQRFQVGEKPFRWWVSFSHEGSDYRKGVEPDHMFALELPDDRTEVFFLEADRQNMPVETSDMDRSSILKKLLQYWESWQTPPFGDTNLFEEHFGIPNIRTIFALFTGHRGDKRLNRCIEANKRFFDGDGTGLFLFANVETLLEADDILTAPLISGRGTEKLLIK